MANKASSIIELLLDLKNPDDFKRQLTEADNLVKSVASDIKDQLGTAVDTTMEALTGVAGATRNALEKLNIISRDNFDILIQTMEERVSSALEGIVNDLGGILGTLKDRFGRENIEMLFASLGKMGNYLRDNLISPVNNFIDTLRDAPITTAVKGIYGALGATGEAIKTSFRAVNNTLEGTSLFAKSMAGGIWSAVSAVGKYTGLTKAASTATQAISTIAENAFSATESAVIRMTNYFRGAHNNLQRSVEGVKYYVNKVATLKTALSGIKKAATISLSIVGITAGIAALKSVYGTARKQFSGIFDVFDTFNDYLGAALEPIIIEFQKLVDEIAPVIISMLTPFLQFVLSTVRWIVDAISELFTSSKGLGRTIQSVLQPLWEFSKSSFTFFVDLFRTLASSLLPVIQKFIGALRNSFVQIRENLSPDFMDTLKDLGQSIGELIVALAPLVSFLLKVISVVTNKLMAPALMFLITKMIEGFTMFVDLLTSIFSYFSPQTERDIQGFFTRIIDWITGLVKWLPSVVSQAYEDMLVTLINMWRKFQEMLGLDSIKGNITGVFKAMMATINATWDTIKGVINKYLIEPVKTALEYDLPLIGSIANTTGIKIKTLATGGVVQKPALAQIGEAGPEVVLPLKKDVIAEVIPEFVKTEIPALDTSKPIITKHGATMVEILGDLKELLSEIVATSRDTGASNIVQTDMPIKLGLSGFVE